jgi:hypothetical protein
MILNKTKSHILQITVVCSVYLLIQLIFRSEVLLNGRLLAEEGSLWWARSLDGNFFSTLFFIPPMAGYFYLNSNLLMIFANFLPLSWLALTTTWVSLIIQVQVAFIFLLLTRNREWKFRIVVFSIIAFSPIFTDAETFANSINSQTYLALIPILYLAMWVSPSTLFSKVYLYCFMFLAFFSGWYSAILFPLFLARFLLGERTSFHKKVVITSFLGLCVQISAFLYQKQNGLLYPGKGTVKLDLQEIKYDFLSILKFSLTGVQDSSQPSILQVWGVSTFFIALLISGKFRFDLHTRLIERKGFWFSLAFVGEYVLVYFGDAAPGPGLWGRYLLVPSGTLILFIALIAGDRPVKVFPVAMALIPMTALAIVVPQYSLTSSHHLLNCVEPCLSWSENVKKVSTGEVSAYYFWPFNAGNPDWAISSIDPKVRLAPFQADKMGQPVVVLPPIETVKR